MAVSPQADPLLVRGEAWFSECARYRYGLTRVFLDMKGAVPVPDRPSDCPNITWIMLNPSTADAQFNDPTISKCCRFSRKWGYEQVTIVNLFGWRATDPRQLAVVEDPIGPENDNFIVEAVAGSDITICAWGMHGRLRDRSRAVVRMLRELDLTAHLHALRWSKGPPAKAEPWHPLYLPEDLRPIPWQTTALYTGS